MLAEIYGYRNWLKYTQFERDFVKHISQSDNMILGIPKLKRYLKLPYIDSFNNKHIDYFEIPFTQAVQITNANGAKIFKRYNDLKENKMVDIDQLNFETIERILKERSII